MSDEWTPGYLPANGTDGDVHRSTTCHCCTIDHDGGWHDGRDDGESCPIMMTAMLAHGDEPGPDEWQSRWVERDDGRKIQETRCMAWVGPCSCLPSSAEPGIMAYIERVEQWPRPTEDE